MYKVRTKVVYPYFGVGTIDEVEEKQFANQSRKYYVMKLPLVNIAGEKGLREVASEKDIARVLEILCEEPSKMEEDWKVRHQENTDKLKRGKIEDLAEVVRDLYRRNSEKDLSTSEKKLFETAFQLIIEEIALSKGDSKVDIEHLITQTLSEGAT